MIVVCKCGQKNRVKASIATGGVPAKDVLCGDASCKLSLRQMIAEQADRNSHIVLDIVEACQKARDDEDADVTSEDLVAIFAKHGMDLLPPDDEDEEDTDDDEEEDEDDEEEEPEPVKKKKVTKKPAPKSKKKKSASGNVH